ncbi:alpha/beta hydrolase family protein [Rheinheimera marina]|uniref:Alpha/beta hydrolase family protein n=1 Tax=Rheinheimera marina TaxID=1774958 RepID=A0ABV9JL49_9GAMM
MKTQRIWTTLIALAATVLLSASLSGCSAKASGLSPAVWQQHLNLPSVQQAEKLADNLDAQVTQTEFSWFDQSRQRTVPALLFSPKTTARPDHKAALLVFSHGLGGSKERYAYLGQYWASQGYYSLHLQHDGSDRKVWQGSRLLLPFRLMDAADESEALARVQDVRFALDQFLASDASQGVDPNQILMAGHSYGANTAMLLSGAQVEQNGQLVSLKDPRIKAAILISAPPFYNDQPLQQVLADVTIPTLHITTTEDEIKVPGYYSSPQDRLELFYAMASPYKVMAVFNGGSHNVFSGWRRNDETANQNKVIKAATQALSAAFIQQVISGDSSALQLWQQQHQAVLADFIRSDMLALR